MTDLEDVMEEIKQAAQRQRIDFDDSANAFTVWSEVGNDMQHCGSRPTLDGAQTLAHDHIHLNRLYVVRASSRRRFDIVEIGGTQ
jgi:hypothetical protein